MKNKFLKLASLILCLSLTVVLSGCGGSDSDKADDRRVLKWEVLKAGYGTVPYEKLAEAFMKDNPDVLVKIVFNPSIKSTTASRLESNNNLSDVYSISSIGDIKRWVIKGWVEPLDDVFDSALSNGKTIRESTKGNSVDCCSYKGVAYAIPEYVSLTGFVYNKTLFDKYKWSVPTNTAELDKLCRKIISDTNSKVSPIVYCGGAADGYLYFGTENWIYQYEGIKNLDKFYAFENAEVFNPSIYKGKAYALQNLQKFFFDEGKYAMANSAGMTHIVAQSKLIQGEAAMMLNGSWFENEMSEVLSKNKEVELGMFAVPELSDSSGKVLHSDSYTTVDNKRVLASNYGSFYFMPSNAANKEDGKKFLKFLSEQSSCEMYTRYTNAIRPFDYELSAKAEVYSEMSAFGKSILTMADENYLYSPYSSNPIAIKGLTGLWARGKTPYIDIRDGVETINQALENDYEYAKTNWSAWEGMTD